VLLSRAFARCLPFLPLALAAAMSPVLTAQTPSRASLPNNRYQQGLQAWQSGDLKTARSAFAAAVKTNPRDSEAQNAYGQVLLQLGDIDSAIVHFRLVTRLRPELGIAHVYLGQALLQKGLLADAEQELRAGVRLAPQQPSRMKFWREYSMLSRRAMLQLRR